MSLLAYRGTPFKHTHENIAFDGLYHQLAEIAGKCGEPVRLFGNFLVGGSEIDAAIMLPHAILVVDFKHYGGAVAFSENGQWTADGVLVKGGNHRNPLLQLRDNKYALLNWLKRSGVLDRKRGHDLGRISAMVLFDRPIQFDSASLPPKVAPWFHVVDTEHCVERVAAIRTDQINLTVSELDRVAAELRLDEYSPPGAESGIGTAPQVPGIRLAAGLLAPLNALRKSIDGDAHTVHIVAGMLGTGIESLLAACYQELVQDAYCVVVLAPNQSIAARKPIPARSIYSLVYDTGSPQEEGDLIVYPVARNQDSLETVYLVADAHLVTSSLLPVLDLRRYGSGCLLDDLLHFASLPESDRQVVFFGDPYQLGRGPANRSSLCAEHVRQLTGKDVFTLELEHVEEPARDARTRNAVAIVRQLRASVYNQLSLETDQALTETKNLSADLAAAFGGDPVRAKVITYSNASANAWNRTVRDAVFKRSIGLEPGDIVHIHNSPIASDPDDPMQPANVPGGSFAQILRVHGSPMVIRQSLKGRPKPIEIALARVDVQLVEETRGIASFFYSCDYLEAQTPTMERDTLLALRVNALSRCGEHRGSGQSATSENRAACLRSDPYLNAAHARFGFALTLHRAQGKTYPLVLADLCTEFGLATEEYFRWIYTLLAVSDGRLIVSNIPTITPFTGVDWDESQAKLGTAHGGNLVPYDPKRETSGRIPAGMENQPGELVNLYLHLADAVAPKRLRVDVQTHHRFQELYKFVSDAGEWCVLALMYNKRFEVTRIERRECTSAAFAGSVQETVTSRLSAEDAFPLLILGAFSAMIKPKSFRVSGITHRPYREIYTIEHASGSLLLHLDYNSSGFVTRIAPQEYTDAGLIDELRKALF